MMAPVLTVVVAGALAARALPTTQSLPPAPLAGTRACASAPFAGHVRVKDVTCRRGRQVAHFFETVGRGRCPGGWTLRRYALPAGVEAVGGSYLSCHRTRARVLWLERGE
jgi:hypothetical protein